MATGDSRTNAASSRPSSVPDASRDVCVRTNRPYSPSPAIHSALPRPAPHDDDAPPSRSVLPPGRANVTSALDAPSHAVSHVTRLLPSAGSTAFVPVRVSARKGADPAADGTADVPPAAPPATATRNPSADPESSGARIPRSALRTCRGKLSKWPPRYTRFVPDAAPGVLVTAPAGAVPSYQSRHHSATFPCMSKRPQAFGR